MKTTRIALEVDVPVAVCARCGLEAPFQPLDVQLVQTDAGLRYQVIRAMPSLVPLMIGNSTAMLCTKCVPFIKGGVEALGILMPEPPVAA